MVHVGIKSLFLTNFPTFFFPLKTLNNKCYPLMHPYMGFLEYDEYSNLVSRFL
ncbi:protein of unknown function [Petrocella atlantisensis]|uniref:Uncharacterized protein n=1 Tax=Petrocella atlantisensis TaxID=2173034 RepID=A0A3P7S0H9_9FIRM|nr:protein of unknown function [Petrocella atlantisensis]